MAAAQGGLDTGSHLRREPALQGDSEAGGDHVSTLHRVFRRMVCPPVWLSGGEYTPKPISAVAWQRGRARRQLDVVRDLQGLGVATDELSAKAQELREALE